MFRPYEAIAILRISDRTLWTNDFIGRSLEVRDKSGDTSPRSGRTIQNHARTFLPHATSDKNRTAYAITGLLHRQLSLPWSLNAQWVVESMWKTMTAMDAERIPFLYQPFYAVMIEALHGLSPGDEIEEREWDFLIISHQYLLSYFYPVTRVRGMTTPEDKFDDWNLVNRKLLGVLEHSIRKATNDGERTWTRMLRDRVTMNYVSGLWLSYDESEKNSESTGELLKTLGYFDCVRHYIESIPKCEYPPFNALMCASARRERERYLDLWRALCTASPKFEHPTREHFTVGPIRDTDCDDFLAWFQEMQPTFREQKEGGSRRRRP